MVPRYSQHLHPFTEKLTKNSEEKLKINGQKPYLDAKMAIFGPKESPKWVKSLMSEFYIHLFVNKQ